MALGLLGGPIDVAVPTWNSGRYLGRCLAALRADSSFPLGRVFIVDRNSSDSTRSIASSYGCEVLTDTTSLGSARQRALDHARTPWLLFLDSDVELTDGWFTSVRSFDGSNVGALQPLPVPPWMHRPRVLRDYERRMFPKGGPRTLTPGGRGYTYCTLLRRDAAAGVDLRRFEAYEDKALSDRVQANGYEWRIVPVFPTHHMTLRESGRKARWNAAGRRDTAPVGTGRVLREALGGVRRASWDTFRFLEPRFLLTALVVHWNTLRGHLRPASHRTKFATRPGAGP